MLGSAASEAAWQAAAAAEVDVAPVAGMADEVVPSAEEEAGEAAAGAVEEAGSGAGEAAALAVLAVGGVGASAAFAGADSTPRRRPAP